MLVLMGAMAFDDDNFRMCLGHRRGLSLERGQQVGPRAKLGDNLRAVGLNDSLHPVIFDIFNLDRQIGDSLAQERKHPLGSANLDQSGRSARTQPGNRLAPTRPKRA